MEKLKKMEGFTLLELMVAMAVASVLMAGVAAFLQSTTEVYVTQDTTVNMQQEVRAAIEFMDREMRMAGFDPSGDAGAGLVTADPDEISFTMDIEWGSDGVDNDGDTEIDEIDEANGDILDAGEQITYALDADGNLTRTANGVNNDDPVTIARNIDALDFKYLDANGNITTTLADIRTVQITIVARSGKDLPGFFIRYTDNTNYYDQDGYYKKYADSAAKEMLFPGGYDDTTDPTPILPAPGDDFRRIFLYETVELRNL